jgi:hypothetical protein
VKPERWQVVKQLLDDALEHPPADRAAFLAEACGDDLMLRAEVESLLAVAEGTRGFLQPSPPKESTSRRTSATGVPSRSRCSTRS